ncbi:MAG: hypothetical protein WEC75_05735 [Dehalococcoidia bacterium]
MSWEPKFRDQATPEDRARYIILDCATEDCYLVIEFIGNLRNEFPHLEEAEKRKSIVRVYHDLVEEGLVRLHRGRQCSYPYSAGRDLDIPPEDLETLMVRVFEWESGPDAPEVCVCGTKRTMDAHNEAYRELCEESQ